MIIYPDGGICSQIAFVALGKAFEDKGYRVKYDISWFQNHGRAFYSTDKSYDKDYDITFDIPKAFPDIHCEIATDDEVRYYRQRYFVDDNQVITYSPPLYIGGYLGRCFHVPYREYFKQHFKPQELLANDEKALAFQNVVRQIIDSKSCGVHIRRGDLSQPHQIYGVPTSITYFIQAIQCILAQDKETKFYIFSDDMRWVRHNIIPHLANKNYVLCDNNGADKGYLDLYLLSKCKSIIASHGSLGIFAKILSSNDTLLITPKYNELFHELDNILIANWGNATGGGGNTVPKKK